jgi:copper chaperone
LFGSHDLSPGKWKNLLKKSITQHTLLSWIFHCNQRKGEMGMRTITIQGMSCQHCVASVTKALQAIPGVGQVNVDLAKKEANYAGEVDPGVVKKAITAIGFTVLDVK